MDLAIPLLEKAGFIVTGTFNDGVALDLAGSSDYAALLIADDVSELDRRYVTTEARKIKPAMAVVIVQSLGSVLTQLRQAGIITV